MKRYMCLDHKMYIRGAKAPRRADVEIAVGGVDRTKPASSLHYRPTSSEIGANA
jgi:hypothetical protein